MCTDGLTAFHDRENPSSFLGTSDLAIDDRSNVYTAAPEDQATGPLKAFIQKLNPNALAETGDINFPLLTTVTRWPVGGGAGKCPTIETGSDYGSCIAGIDLDEKNQHIVYFSAPDIDAIGELNTKLTTKNLRFWYLKDLEYKLGLKAGTVSDPRQLKVANEDGKAVVWVVTGSGHVVRLIRQSGDEALMSAHLMPFTIDSDTFGVAPDGDVVGYTAVEDSASGLDRKDKVGMLLPKDNIVRVVAPPMDAQPFPHDVLVQRTFTVTMSNFVKADKKPVQGRVFRNKQGDTFVDAFINMPKDPMDSPSFRPMGITPDFGSKVGTFFYAVGTSADLGDTSIIRVGRAFLPPAQRGKHARDDDDFDGDGKKNKYDDDDDDGDGTMNAADRDDDNDCKDDDIDDKDDDNDGHEDKWDDPRKKETRNSKDHTTAAGSSTTHQIVVPAGATLVVAQATAADGLTPVKVEIISPAGLTLASPLPTPGIGVATFVPTTAGTYTVRVTNLGIAAATFTTDLITQELWPALTAIVP